MQWKQGVTIPRENCRRLLGRQGVLVHENTLCTLSQNGQGVCNGDSGGPLVNQQGAVVGVVSWGVPCGTRRPDVYARVFPHNDFIRRATGIRN